MRALATILAALLVLAPAAANGRGRWTAHRAGVLVVLTNEVSVSLKSCEHERHSPRIAVAVAYDGKATLGCWSVVDRHILIDWLDRKPDSVFDLCEFSPYSGNPCPRNKG